MNLDKRITQIERRQNLQTIRLRIARFIVEPDAEILGYECEGETIRREQNESLTALNSRAIDTVFWPPHRLSKTFYPLAR